MIFFPAEITENYFKISVSSVGIFFSVRSVGNFFPTEITENYFKISVSSVGIFSLCALWEKEIRYYTQ